MNRSVNKASPIKGASESSQKPLLLGSKPVLSLVARRISIPFALTVPSLFLGLFGCGTLGGSDQIISVDSTHRGTSVYDSRGRQIGKTPFFVKLKPDFNRALYTRGEYPKKLRAHSLNCQFNPYSAVENMPLGILGSAVGSATLFGALPSFIFTVVTGTAVDTVSGAALRCDESQVLPSMRAQNQLESPTESCAVLTPNGWSTEERAQVLDVFQNSQFGKTNCRQLVKESLILDTSRLLGNRDEYPEFINQDQGRLNKWGFRVGANRVVWLSVTLNSPYSTASDDSVSKNVAASVSEESSVHPAVSSEADETSTLVDSAAGAPDGAREIAEAVHSSDKAENGGQARSRVAVAAQTTSEPKTKTKGLSLTQQNKDKAAKPNQPLTAPSSKNQNGKSATSNDGKSVRQIRAQRLEIRGFDLHRAEALPAEHLSVELPTSFVNQLNQTGAARWFRKSIHLLPSALAIGSGPTSLATAQNEYSSAKFHLTGLHVSRPERFGRWDYAFSFSPDLTVDYFGTDYRDVTLKNGVSGSTKALSINRLAVGAVAGVETHAPAGALGLDAILGSGYFWTNTSDSLTPLWGLRLRYTGFMSREVFLRFEVRKDWIDADVGGLALVNQLSQRVWIGADFLDFSSVMRAVFQ